MGENCKSICLSFFLLYLLLIFPLIAATNFVLPYHEFCFSLFTNYVLPSSLILLSHIHFFLFSTSSLFLPPSSSLFLFYTLQSFVLPSSSFLFCLHPRICSPLFLFFPHPRFCSVFIPVFVLHSFCSPLIPTFVLSLSP